MPKSGRDDRFQAENHLMPHGRPGMLPADTRHVVEVFRSLIPAHRRADPVMVLAVRGYFEDELGVPDRNDRGFYDDAMFVIEPHGVHSFNANTDPSVSRPGIAALVAPQAVFYVPGIHKAGKPGEHPAFRQNSPVRVLRDGSGEDMDNPRARFWINLHRGGENTTSSAGCQTVPPGEWPAFKALLESLLKDYGQADFCYLLIDEAQRRAALGRGTAAATPLMARQREPAEAALDPRFTASVVSAAQKSEAEYGVPCPVTLAQWALESGFGKRMPAQSNNPFGIKARSGEPYVTAWTSEVLHGQSVRVPQAFRAFSSLDEAFAAHARLLARGAPYAAARRFLNEPDRFADALTGVYATDPLYGSKLRSIMRQHNLYALRGTGPAPSTILTDETESFPYTPGQGPLSSERVRSLQAALVAKGYPLGAIDGKFGPLTRAALLAFQADNTLPTTGVLDATTFAALDSAPARTLDVSRVAATEESVAQAGSTIIRDAKRSRLLGWITTALGALGVGNSAVVNAGKSAVSTPDSAVMALLTEVQKLPAASAPDQLKTLATSAKAIAEHLAQGERPEIAKVLAQIRASVPTEDLAKLPDLQKLLDALGTARGSAGTGVNTIFDLLPGFFANGSVLETAMKGVALTASSTLPGFAGSLALVAAGLVGRHFANTISAARVHDHRTAQNAGN